MRAVVSSVISKGLTKEDLYS
uniref:Uncharacterized protein n=1 Tax=Anguilla anguilla TaxID=7936 RepID=A0A0E9QJZ4_ANGAN